MSAEKLNPLLEYGDIIKADEVFVYVNPLKGKHVSINNSIKTVL